jgi:hypothetical protein
MGQSYKTNPKYHRHRHGCCLNDGMEKGYVIHLDYNSYGQLPSWQHRIRKALIKGTAGIPFVPAIGILLGLGTVRCLIQLLTHSH